MKHQPTSASPGLLRDRRATVSLEFALIALAYFPLAFGVIEAGLLLWTKNALQTAANRTARCVAISSPDCTNAAQYAVSQATSWVNAHALTNSGVSVQTSTGCTGTSGTMVKVTVTSTSFSSVSFISQLATSTLTATGCYPVSP